MSLTFARTVSAVFINVFHTSYVFSKAKLCNICKTIKKQTATTKFSYDLGKSIDKK